MDFGVSSNEGTAQSIPAIPPQPLDSAMAEIIAATMHNLRNAINPVLINLDLSQENLSGFNVRELNTALQELQAADLNAERREKLHAYLLAGVDHLGKLLEDTRTKYKDSIERLEGIDQVISAHEQFAVNREVRQELNLRAIINEVAASKFLSRQQGIRLELDLDSIEGSKVSAEQLSLQLVFRYLLINGVEAILRTSGGKGVIRVSADLLCKDETEYLRLSVCDNGSGLDPDDLGKVFQEGFTTKEIKDSRLGLHWCKATIEDFGGQLTAESKGSGQGACFYVMLPCFHTS
ncbi:MAG: sensor histidine kinase [Proteobacteria bacterium]|nr:sensor histidine kinase [Pseudomonadota bacterium]MBU1687935.1 sensor histidine kinase [Pseudomonadota bacterium]